MHDLLVTTELASWSGEWIVARVINGLGTVVTRVTIDDRVAYYAASSGVSTVQPT